VGVVTTIVVVVIITNTKGVGWVWPVSREGVKR
jgi:hypothetical protein